MSSMNGVGAGRPQGDGGGLPAVMEGAAVRREVRSFPTTTQGLLALADWLWEVGCTQVAMEATGVYFALSSALSGRVEVPPALG